MNSLPSDLLVIAGAGELPALILQGARTAGVSRIGVLGVAGSTPCSTMRLGDWRQKVSVSSLQHFRDVLKNSGFRYAILAGQISPLSFFRAAFDPEIVSIFRTLGVRNAHTIFTRLIDEIQQLGLEVLPSSLFLAPHIPTPGVLTETPLSEAQQNDVDFGMHIAMGVCDLDIGQTVVVRDGVALAIEGFEGTDSTIRRGGRIARRDAAVIKVAKHGHDMRFDIPVVGLRTLRTMKRAKCSLLAVQAGRTLFLNLPGVVQTARNYGITIVAVDSKLPAAPTLPRQF